jgi:N-acetylmuramoyl-L-alanine amidase
MSAPPSIDPADQAAPVPPRRRALHRLGGRVGSLVLLLTLPQLARGAAIVAVRMWPAPDYTRVTIESDQPLQASHLLLQGPDRMVIDLQGLALSDPLRELVGKVQPNDPYVERVRVGQFTPEVVRLVMDLKQPVRPQQFTLLPVAVYQHRLVFDLYPVEEADPLLALIREKEAAETEAARAVQDALGELIARLDLPATAQVPLPAPAQGAAPTPAPCRRRRPPRSSRPPRRLPHHARQPAWAHQPRARRRTPNATAPSG